MNNPNIEIAKGLKDKVIDIQQRLKAPKDEYNEFGGFKYRNVESIELALKPLLKEHGLLLILSDEVVAVGERIYVKATATLSSDQAEISVSAFAREDYEKKKMDGSQLTGSSSSYARKYALGGLFLIDDTKDADSTKTEAPKPDPSLAKAKQDVLHELLAHDIKGFEAQVKYIESVIQKKTIDDVIDANKIIDSFKEG